MKKVFIASLLALSAFSASAQVAATVNIGVNSNNIYRGQSVSDDKPSVTAGFGLSTKVATATVYGDVQASTAVDNGKVDLTVGVTVPVGPLTVGGGYRNHSYVSKSFEFDKTMKSSEVFVGVSVDVAGGKLAGEYSRNNHPSDYKVDFMKLGYTHQVLVPQLTFGATVTAYKRDAVRLNGYELSAAYAFTKNLNANALVAYTRKDAFSDKLSPVASVGMSYKF